MKRRLPVLLALVGAGSFLLASCGSELQGLRLSRTGRDATKLAAGANEASDVMWWPGVEYVVKGTLPTLAEKGRAWNVTAPSLAASKKHFAALASHLGVEGDIVATPGDTASWSIGLDPESYTGMNMYVSESEVWWSYYGDSPNRTVSSDCTKIVGPDGSVSEDCGTWVEPEKPKNLPTRAAAEKAMLSLLEAGGENVDNYAVSVTLDDWGVYAQAIRMVDSMESSFMWWMSFGEDAKVTGANGTFVRLESNGSYPLADPNKAVSRLTTWMFAARATDLVGGAQLRSDGGEIAVDSDNGASEPGSPGTGETPPATGGGTAPVDPVPVEPMPPVPSEPVVVTITGVRLGLMAAYLEDGRVMLLPSYIYTNADGDVGSVYAIVDEYLGFADPVDDTVPDTTDGPQPTVPAIDDAVADTLVGLSEDDATKNAEGNGWIVRIAQRDGQTFALTDDYVVNRVNLSITDGVVVDVTVG